MSLLRMPFRYLGHYFRTTFRLLIHPRDFFAAMPVEGGTLLPILFAVVTHWLASAISFFWKVPVFRIIQEGIREGSGLWNDFAGDLSKIDSPGRDALSPLPLEAWTRMKELILPWFWGASSVLLDPFYTLATTMLTSVIVYVGARIFIDTTKPIRFNSVLRIMCFAGTPVLWSVIPIAGALIAPIAVIATTTLAFVEVYHTSTFRALIVAIFPKLTLLIGILGAFAVFSWIAFRTLSALFGLS